MSKGKRGLNIVSGHALAVVFCFLTVVEEEEQRFVLMADGAVFAQLQVCPQKRSRVCERLNSSTHSERFTAEWIGDPRTLCC